jgi:hypothetical protein
MAQIKIYGHKAHLDAHKAHISDVIHSCVVEALDFPIGKRAHRFLGLDESEFYMPEGRTNQ